MLEANSPEMNRPGMKWVGTINEFSVGCAHVSPNGRVCTRPKHEGKMHVAVKASTSRIMESWSTEWEHDYVPLFTATTGETCGVMVCRWCCLPADSELSWPCASGGPGPRQAEWLEEWVSLTGRLMVAARVDVDALDPGWDREHRDLLTNYSHDALEFAIGFTHYLTFGAAALISRYRGEAAMQKALEEQRLAARQFSYEDVNEVYGLLRSSQYHHEAYDSKVVGQTIGVLADMLGIDGAE